MNSFAERLKSEIEYSGMLQKEIAYKAGIKKRALDMYIGAQESMPPADVAVRLAKVLNVTVEYLVTGETHPHPIVTNFSRLEKDLSALSPEIAESIENLVHKIAGKQLM
ncbi:helix-turn-helix domain-containing protein [Treponema brennaborense]|uniref:Helix-turn-helix domain protein n=1 Tax=Treponema brennaborense (strain DSM 12168 / CIP 105900 / DD5/3) TaxID=906968 RepID=F4LPS4_TREBD|nr:helix-turn-helix transcriptional regulator [Treponema brennaborense]AEE17070.1 helix-turn-helix domain protein [Treponema brennaborense DSM 12168]